jgi:hypothetical protein
MLRTDKRAMKLRTYLGVITILAAGLFYCPLVQAQYAFTTLDLLGSTQGGSITLSGSNVLVNYLDSNKNPSSFLYSENRYTLIDDIVVGTKTAAVAMDSSNIIGNVEDTNKIPHGFLYNAGVFTSLDYPGSKQTVTVAITGSNIIGNYEKADKIGHGFLYINGVFTSIDYPAALKTGVSSISGTSIIGTYEDAANVSHGFLYNSGTYTSITYPGSVKTYLNGISGTNIVGIYKNTGQTTHGFLYNSITKSYTSIFYPLATKSTVGGVDGNNVVGVYQPTTTDTTGDGFLYSNGSYTSIAYPGSTQTVITGISGNLIVGSYLDSFSSSTGTGGHTNFNALPQGYIYNITGHTYTTLDVPGSRRTAITGISGTNIVGIYEDINFVYHGFLAVPASKALSLGGTLAFGSVTVNTTATGTLTITNTGTATATVSGITYPAGFSGSWSGPIAPGSVQKVTVTFAPTSTTSYGGNISVASNATGSPNTIAVSGTGIVAVPALVGPAPTPITFGQWATQYSLVGGSTSAPMNDGVANLLKYLCDISPTSSMTSTDRAALPTMGTATVSGTQYLTLTYRRNAALSGITVHVQTSPDLQNWTTVNPPDLSQQIGTDATTTEDPIMEVGVKANGTGKQFIRLDLISP